MGHFRSIYNEFVLVVCGHLSYALSKCKVVITSSLWDWINRCTQAVLGTKCVNTSYWSHQIQLMSKMFNRQYIQTYNYYLQKILSSIPLNCSSKSSDKTNLSRPSILWFTSPPSKILLFSSALLSLFQCLSPVPAAPPPSHSSVLLDHIYLACLVSPACIPHKLLILLSFLPYPLVCQYCQSNNQTTWT